MIQAHHIKKSDNSSPWKVLILDGELSTHISIQKALENFSFKSKRLIFLHAYSIKEAKNFFQKQPDIDLVIASFLVESSQVVLNLVQYIREEMENHFMRVILRSAGYRNDINYQLMEFHDISIWQQENLLNFYPLRTELFSALNTLILLKQMDFLQEETSLVVNAASRFIPHTFLNLLGKKDITEIKLGDYIEQEMTVLFLDIRSFTKISERLEPLEIFQLLNRFTRYIEPIIVKHYGFIDKYIGDSLMALFPQMADNALDASVEILSALRLFNRHQSKKRDIKIKIGIGINTGWVVMGAIGTRRRVDCTVISDAVNVAARVEKLNKQLGSSILISDKTLQSLHSVSSFLYRYLGRFTLSGKKIQLGLYEVLEEGQFREGFIPLFNQAINLYEKGKISEAKDLFEALLEVNEKEDPVLQYFLSRL
jgi:adenylate cyclase